MAADDTSHIDNNYCVYLHWNYLTGEMYVGQTQNPTTRWAGHGSSYTGKVKDAFEHYGWENFWHTVLEDGLTQQQAYYYEEKYIAKFRSVKRGYNTEPGYRKAVTAYDTKNDEIFYFESRRETAKFLAGITGCPEEQELYHIKACLSENSQRKRRDNFLLFNGRIPLSRARKEAGNSINTGNSVKVTVEYPEGPITYNSHKEAAQALNISYSGFKNWMKKGMTGGGYPIISEAQATEIMATKDGKEKLFSSCREFANYVGASVSNVTNALKRPEKRSVHGWKLKYIN